MTKFEDAINTAITSRKQSRNISENHFADAGKMIDIDKGAAVKLYRNKVIIIIEGYGKY